MTLTDHLKNTCEQGSVILPHGVKYPSYMVNRYISHLSPIHNTIISNFLNMEYCDGMLDQDVFEITKQFVPKMGYNWNMFKGYQSLPKKEIDPLRNQKLDFVSRYFDVSRKEAGMMLEKEDFHEEVEKVMKTL